MILREDGGLTVAKSVKFNVIDPAKEFPDIFLPGEAEGVPVQDEEDQKPQSRKELKKEIEFIARKRFEEEDFSIDGVLQIYDLLEELGDTDMRMGRKSSATSWFSGAFVHGGKAGTRMNFREYPFATRYLAAFGRKYAGRTSFSAIDCQKCRSGPTPRQTQREILGEHSCPSHGLQGRWSVVGEQGWRRTKGTS